jgi:predicted Abi (CAAX) family protease
MLNKGLRDEESIRIDNVLRTLRSLDFVPKALTDDEKFAIENQLKELALNMETLIAYQNDELITLLVRLHLDWNQLEQFADFLIDFSTVENYNFEHKALAIYQYIQQENKVFSFGINAKITSLKNS